MNCPKCGTSLLVPHRAGTTAAPGGGEPARDRPEGPSPSLDELAGASPPSSGFFDAVELSSDELRTLFPEEEGGDEGQGASAAPLSEGIAVGPDDPARSAERGADRPERTGDEEASVPGAVPSFLRAPAPTASALRPESAELGGANEVMVRPRPARDVVIPRLAVLSWSLFVLVALFLAFVAGLLVGHFVWR
ncbi:hypothetical protein AB1L88_06815 [Tautonia sp. JC769]|uniref:hypothetical protein n=1 Tax=Tautonia sp. JC769 TaxID=3232135 RepID=UPI00345AC1AE